MEIGPETVLKKYVLKEEKFETPSSIDFEAALNPEQLAVVKSGNGASLVIAGAGSGKTHTLTHRVAYLLDRGVQPDRIMLLTFTNKAARSMTNKVAELIDGDIKRVWSGTFHSIANRILRRYATELAYPEAYSILDMEDSGTLMNACRGEVNEAFQEQRFPRGRVLAKMYSYCVNTQTKIADVLKDSYPQFEDLAEPIREVFRRYQSRKLEMGLMDFDDLLLNWKRLLTEVPKARDELMAQFEHILVDEYQDTNSLQGEIVDLMASVHRNIMVVGDDCQSIYGFRGANYANILEFPKRYPECQQFRLQTNYRSTPQILEVANRSIAHNVNQFEKTLKPSRPEGLMPAGVQLKDVYQQAAFICQRILELADEGISLSEIAVLYRAHHHSMELQVEMTKRGIPYVVRSGVRFFEQSHIKDALAYLKFLYNPKDELSFLRLAQHYQGIGSRRAHELWTSIAEETDPLAAAAAPALAESLPNRAQFGWNKASKLMDDLRKGRLTKSPGALVDMISKGPYKDYVERSFDNFENRMGDLDQLANYAEQYDDIDRFLGEITLMHSMSGQDILVGGSTPDEYVCLSSIHQAKGLEWSAVFVLALSDGLFPSENAISTPEGEEEERRLFYVATTRPRDELYLCHVFTNMGRGRRPTVLRESLFLDELRNEDGRELPWEEWIIDAG